MDDIEFTSGGSLACWIGEGWTVSLVVCTDGGKGSYFPHQLVNGLSPHQVSEAYLYGTAEADTWVDITATFEQKMTAIAARSFICAVWPSR